MATVRQALTAGAFVSIGPGPLFMQNLGSDPVYFVIDTTPPTGTGDINDWPQHRLGGDGNARDISINFTQNIYVRGRGSVVYTK